MIYLLTPLMVVLAIGLVSLNIKIGFMVADWTEPTGFGFGFYMMTVLGLQTAEICLVIFLVEKFG